MQADLQPGRHAVSRLTSKYQATIPKNVRELLGLKQGDLVLFAVEDQRVTLERVPDTDTEFTAALGDTLEEWLSPEDEEAYGDL